MSKAWKIDELVRKYPIKNIWEWKFTGNTISSTVRLNDIKEDPKTIKIELTTKIPDEPEDYNKYGVKKLFLAFKI